MSSQKRAYELKERAKHREDTRRRIVDATVELHQERGPAATTVAEIARRAGVSRLTVYNHFPADADLFAACQREFFSRTPLPELAPALALADPHERLGKALAVLYRSYRRQEPMTGKVLRDRAAVPALDALLARTLDVRQAELAEALGAGLAGSGRARIRTRAVIALVLEFSTWQRLTQSGMTDASAARLAAALVTQTASGAS